MSRVIRVSCAIKKKIKRGLLWFTSLTYLSSLDGLKIIHRSKIVSSIISSDSELLVWVELALIGSGGSKNY